MEALKSVEPPVLVPIAALPALLPPPAVDAEQLVQQFYELRDRYGDVIRIASGVDAKAI